MTRILIDGCAIATVDDQLQEFARGFIVLDGARIAAVGEGVAPSQERESADTIIDGAGLLATPGLVNCHHHMFQHLTRGIAQQSTLFEWLVELYPTWACIDAEMERAASRAAITALLISGCSTATDHHYLHPRDAGDLLATEIEAAADLGIRFHPCRGSMDLGESSGGLPPDHVVEDRDEILQASEAAFQQWHDPSPESMLRIAFAPCSPFSVTRELMTESAELARKHGVRLHTHLAETVEEDAYCLEQFGMRPVDYLAELGWLGDDVWLAHCVHLNPSEVARFGATGTGVAHCPSSNARLGAGIAPVADLLQVGAPVGLGVDGAASNEAGELSIELREALLVARLRGGPAALTARQALSVATIGGAQCLGRAADIGSIEVGKLADIALWNTGAHDVASAGIADPIAALVFGPSRRVQHLFVQGVPVVQDGALQTADHATVAQELATQCNRLASVAGIATSTVVPLTPR